MKILFALLLLMLCSSMGYAQSSTPASGSNLKSALAAAKSAAKASAESWLAVFDSGDIGKTWDLVLDDFQAAVTRKAWIAQAQPVQDQTGKFVSRALKSVYFTDDIPGAPSGVYALIQYDGSYEKAKAATETITMTQETDGSWKVSGYFVNSAPAGS